MNSLCSSSVLLIGALALAGAPATCALRASTQRSHFIGLRDFAGWTSDARAGAVVLTSPPLSAPPAWNELVVSWNAILPSGAALTIEARGLFEASADGAPPHQTKFYTLGRWSGDVQGPRQSVNGQGDADGDVLTDTLVLRRRGARLQLRLTLNRASLDGTHFVEPSAASLQTSLLQSLRFVGLSFLDNTVAATPRESSRTAWGRIIAVPENFQNDFADQGDAVWCSPTSVSMILGYWAALLQRPELNRSVPDVAREVHDPQWPGTGNWVLNTAFAGSFPGLRAYVRRLDDLSEVEAWIARGVPLALSLSYDKLKGNAAGDSGHLVVCAGFTPEGDVVIADPAWKPAAGEHFHVFARSRVVDAWASSHNTVYIIHPETIAD